MKRSFRLSKLPRVTPWRGLSRWQRLRRGLTWAALAALVSSTAFLVYVYSIPYPVAALDTGGPLVLTDRHGTELRSIPAQSGRPGRAAWVELESVPGPVIGTLLESEDKNFYSHPGVDPMGIIRACLLNLSSGRFAFGGSTLTMQLAKMVHHPGEPRTLGRKLKEVVLALRMERALDKDEILEQYLNRAYYSNGAYGIEAAAQRYFGKPATSLAASEATLLAAIPRAPTAYNPLRHLPKLRERHAYLLEQQATRGLLSKQAALLLATEPLELHPEEPEYRAPHFVEWVLSELPEAVRNGGGVVRTSLDWPLQQALERRAASHQAELADHNLQQTGVIVLDSMTSEVRAMVGAVDGHSVNITVRRRHPGSALKPFVYAAAIETGDHPASIALDIHDVDSAYRNRHLTQKEHGPTRYREALAGSFNLAAVHVLEKVGIEQVLSDLRRAGVGELESTPQEYGLRLALGSAKVRLLDLAAGYGFLVRDGRVRPASGVLDAQLHGGATWHPDAPDEREVFSENTAWLVMDMLSDPEARRRAFGYELPFDLPYPVAAKTGTSRGFSDTVAVAATNEFIVAAWAGNFDGSPTQGLVAMDAAAPLVRAGLLAAADGRELTLPKRPAHVRPHTVCALSGMPAGPHCPHHKRDFYDAAHAPQGSCSWHGVDSEGNPRLDLPQPVQRFKEQQLRRAGVL